MMATQEDYDRISAEIDEVDKKLEYVREGFAKVRKMLNA